MIWTISNPPPNTKQTLINTLINELNPLKDSAEFVGKGREDGGTRRATRSDILQGQALFRGVKQLRRCLVMLNNFEKFSFPSIGKRWTKDKETDGKKRKKRRKEKKKKKEKRKKE